MNLENILTSRRASMVVWLALGTLCVASLILAGCASKGNDIDKHAAALAASLAQACPMAAADDAAAHEACRRHIGKGADAAMREYSFLWGGDQPGVALKEKNTTIFRGDLFQDLYLSLYMFTGNYKVSTAKDGTKVIAVQAYFRNGLPPGNYPYPFWHSDKKWGAYEKSNEVRFYYGEDGKIRFAGRSDAGSETQRGRYAHVQPPAFAGNWTWTDAQGARQPAVSLFSTNYSADNPHVAALDSAYRKFALTLRDGDCVGCHSPDGHKKMHTLTLLQTPMHAASNIDEVLREVRSNKMPLDDYNDPKKLRTDLRNDLLATGDAFQGLLKKADAWERDQGRVRSLRSASRG
jgi:hypothetical protein